MDFFLSGLLGSLERLGTFGPVLSVLRGASEQLAVVHGSVYLKLQDLVKELNAYQDTMHKKHKQVNCWYSTNKHKLLI